MNEPVFIFFVYAQVTTRTGEKRMRKGLFLFMIFVEISIANHMRVNHVNFDVKGNASPLHPLVLVFDGDGGGESERVLGHNQRSSITRALSCN
jgi:hypothetical protein